MNPFAGFVHREHLFAVFYILYFHRFLLFKLLEILLGCQALVLTGDYFLRKTKYLYARIRTCTVTCH